jgi:hypothetical protein
MFESLKCEKPTQNPAGKRVSVGDRITRKRREGRTGTHPQDLDLTFNL